MSVLARILGALALLLGIVLGIGFVVPGRWTVEESVAVSAPPDSVSRVLARPEAWREWMAWPETGAEPLGPSYGPGAGFRWDDPTYGSGRFVVLESAPGHSLRYRVTVEDGTIVVRGTLHLEPADTGTLVRWTERGQVGWNPLLGIAALTLEERQRTQLRGALEGLKAHLEGDREDDDGRRGGGPLRPGRTGQRAWAFSTNS